MDKSKHIATILIGLMLLLFFIWAALPKEDFSKNISEKLQKEKTKADVIFKDATLAEIYDGVKYWELISKASSINNSTHRADLATVNGLFFDNGRPSLKFLAPSAVWQIKKNEILLADPFGYDIKSEKFIKDIIERAKASNAHSVFHLPDVGSRSFEGYWFEAKNLDWKLSTKKLLCSGSIYLTKGNILIRSEKLEADVGLKNVVLTGSPSAEIKTDGELLIFNSDKFTVDSNADEVIAEGKVKIFNTRSQVTAARAIYDQKSDVVNLSGDISVHDRSIAATSRTAVYDLKNSSIALMGGARAKRDGNELNGEKITILLGQNRIIVEGGTKVRIKGAQIK